MSAKSELKGMNTPVKDEENKKQVRKESKESIGTTEKKQKCKFPSCKQANFTQIKCNFCQVSYCPFHFHPMYHACESQEYQKIKEKDKQRRAKLILKKKKCCKKECKKPAVKAYCKLCKKYFCASHIKFSKHGCGEEKKEIKKKKPAQTQRRMRVQVPGNGQGNRHRSGERRVPGNNLMMNNNFNRTQESFGRQRNIMNNRNMNNHGNNNQLYSQRGSQGGGRDLRFFNREGRVQSPGYQSNRAYRNNNQRSGVQRRPRFSNAANNNDSRNSRQNIQNQHFENLRNFRNQRASGNRRRQNGQSSYPNPF